MALSSLRSKKYLEDILPKRLRSLETIQVTLDQVLNARGDIEVTFQLPGIRLAFLLTCGVDYEGLRDIDDDTANDIIASITPAREH